MGREDDHLLPGEGNIDFIAIASAFPFISYDGPIQLEAHPAEPETTGLESFCREAIKRARKLRALLTGESMNVDWQSGEIRA
jgi:sugar phosphate isomerase/epimerase